jgi:FkbM family methyltransferase
MRRVLRELVLRLARRLLGRRYFFRVSEALSLAARSEDQLEPESNGERLLQRLVAGALPPGEELVVFDVGANVGEWTSAMHRLRGDGRLRVYAFEPAPAIAARLEERVAKLGDSVRVIRAAATESDGSTQFFFRADNPLISSVADFGGVAAEAIQVPTLRLDTLASRERIGRIHLLKVDAEGYDLVVLRGAAALLREKRIDVVQFEYNFLWIYSRHFLRDAFELFEPHGYRIGKLTRDGVEFYARWQPQMESFHHANFVACLPEWRERLQPQAPPWPE